MGSGELLRVGVGGISFPVVDGIVVNWAIYTMPTDPTSPELTSRELVSGTAFMPVEDYDLWSDDDGYVVDWICEKLNLTQV